MSKPKFIFFKMIGCGHCDAFYGDPTEETSTWAQLKSDVELKKKVDIVLMEWNSHKPLPNEYSFVDYGPYFYLQNGLDSTQGFEMEGVPRTHDAMKEWILEKLRDEPKLNATPVNRNGSSLKGFPVYGTKKSDTIDVTTKTRPNKGKLPKVSVNSLNLYSYDTNSIDNDSNNLNNRKFVPRNY